MSLVEMEEHGFSLPTAEELASPPDGGLCAMDWATRRVFVEVHANINFYRYTTAVAPLLPQLRRAYAACGCLLHTSAIIREPVAHIVSAYRYFHLTDSARSPTTPLKPISEWRAPASRHASPQRHASPPLHKHMPSLPCAAGWDGSLGCR